MNSKWIRFAGSQIAHRSLQKHSGTGGALDLKFGLHLLFRDASIPIPHKLAALVLGAAVTSVLIALETPLEMIVATLLPIAGLAVDLLVDGAELVVCTIAFAAMILPHLAPRWAVDLARTNRA